MTDVLLTLGVLAALAAVDLIAVTLVLHGRPPRNHRREPS